MSWFLVIVLALAAFAVLAFVLKVPRSGWTALGAALMLGLAGYGMQASPGLSGAPKPPAQRIDSDPGAAAQVRDLLDETDLPPSNRWIVIADAMARNGQYANAAQVLLGAVDEDPGNADAWLALGNALVAHADGLITPASLHAYDMAARAAPDSPGPPFFLGQALAQTGRFAEAREIWAALLKRTDADAPWRAILTDRLARLNLLIAAQARAQSGE